MDFGRGRVNRGRGRGCFGTLVNDDHHHDRFYDDDRCERNDDYDVGTRDDYDDRAHDHHHGRIDDDDHDRRTGHHDDGSARGHHDHRTGDRNHIAVGNDQVGRRRHRDRGLGQRRDIVRGTR